MILIDEDSMVKVKSNPSGGGARHGKAHAAPAEVSCSYALVTFGYSLCQWELTGILRLPSFLLLLLGSAAFELAVSSTTVRNLGFFERTS